MAPRKKILYVITKSVWGGAQRYVYDLAAHLSRDRFEPVVAAGGNGPLFEKLQAAGVKTVSVPELERDIHIIKEAKVLARLWHIYNKERPDVIHLSSSKAGGLGALAAFIYNKFHPRSIRGPNSKFQAKIIFTVHGWPFREDKPFIWRSAVSLASLISGWLANTVILINRADFSDAKSFLPERKLAFISNGIESGGALSRARALSREEARTFFEKKLGRPIPKETVILGTVAELTKNKGISYLISAISSLLLKSDVSSNYRSPTSIVVVIGEGEERDKLEQQIESLKLQNAVALAGFLPEARRYLAGFDIFVLPSVKEGLPYTIMEAMAAGIPVVASAVGGVPDLIEHKKTGYLVKPKGSEALADTLAELAADPALRKSLGERAQKSVMARFQLRDMIEKTITLYE